MVERQRQRHRGRQPGPARECARRNRAIAPRIVHPPETVRPSNVVVRGVHRPEPQARQPARFTGRMPPCLQVRRFLVDVVAQLVRDLRTQVPAAQQAEDASDGSHGGHSPRVLSNVYK